MADMNMDGNHVRQFARYQHVSEHLAAEQARLEHELRYVMAQRQRLDAELTAFLRESYGLDTAHMAISIDVERSILSVPDGVPVDAPVDAPEPEQPAE